MPHSSKDIKQKGSDGKDKGRSEGNSLGVVKCTMLIKGRPHFNSIMSLRLGAKGG